MQPNLKHSRQREAIIAFLKTRKDHPTADIVYSNLREQLPNISLGTVYRNLSLLSDRGEILRISCNQKADHFDGFTHPHYHFSCKECGGVSDIEMDLSDIIYDKVSENFDGQITEHTLLFSGVCSNCLQSE